jgi:sulfate adenylyltransferase
MNRKDFTLSVSQTPTLITPYGGKLVDLEVPAEAYDELKAYASQLPSIQISPRSVCDLELLAIGAFSPLDRFMGQGDFQRVLDEMHLVGGHIFPIPVTLPVKAGSDLHLDQDIALRNNEFELLGVMTVEEIYTWDRNELAAKVFGTLDSRHPLVAEMHRWGDLNISGRLRLLHLPSHYDFQELRLTPTQTRAKLEALEAKKVIAFQPGTGLQNVDKTILDRVIKDTSGTLLLHPVVGLTKVGDIDYYMRIRIDKTLIERHYNPDQALLALLPMATRLAGPREALWHALIHRNYGANHMIVNRDHASPTNASGSKTFYNPHAAQELVGKYSQELGVTMLPGPERYERESRMSHAPGKSLVALTPDNQRSLGHRHNGRNFTGWDSHPEIAEILAEIHLPRHRQGICIWFTGLSGSGKSTTAEILTWLLLEHGRRVIVLDGDVVRTHLSKGLGFSKEDRDTNVRRIGFVASELVRLGGVVICAVVSPYRAARHDVRNMVGEGQFVEVFVDTPLDVCEARDVKGMYAKARRGEIKGFTGIDDPYEPPDHPEITLDTLNYSPQQNANLIVNYLIEREFIREDHRTFSLQVPKS